MEFVRLKYANNKLINADIKEHREIITDYVDKRGYDYLGFIPTLFGPNGKILEVDLIFRKPVERIAKPVRRVVERPVEVPKPLPRSEPKRVDKIETPKKPHNKNVSNDLYNDLDLILSSAGEDLLEEKN
jgi:hypothetical protein